ncbi:hypothetical protein SAMN06265182_0483 [Persephonella hydrogeniphila]|uniref:Uncharacterized protein n=1 Tax=Persephonella hydrogeniphila TaxID=198703 RepID=A0A285N300_9AQUI|nr:hypothetical protein [Persephonella hydrogeniphila]SNZ03832.1 hypothetical protein SAMN06265182_0483 [Persephonella hydrogeniphila]
MKIRYIMFLIVMAIPMLYLSCTGSGDTNSTSQKDASLTLSVKFKSKNISSQFISQNIQCIEYEFYDNDGRWINGVLTSNNNQAVIQNVAPDRGFLHLKGYDGYDIIDGSTLCVGTRLDEIYTELHLAEGNNSFVINMIGHAMWEFVDSSNNPSPIVFNKIKTDSQESFNYFVIQKRIFTPASVDETKPGWKEDYDLLIKGSNLYTGADLYPDIDNSCQDTTYCFFYDKFDYILQLIGPNISNNAVETDGIPLSPYTDNDNNLWYRIVFIYGTNPLYDAYRSYTDSYIPQDSFSLYQDDGTDVISDIENRFVKSYVTGPNTMEGIFVEVAFNNSNFLRQKICAWDPDFQNTFPCPQNTVSYTGLKGTIDKIVSSKGINTQSIDQNGCYRNAYLNTTNYWVEYTEHYASCNQNWECDYNLDGVIDQNDDTNGDGNINWEDGLVFFVKEHEEGTLHICVYPFKAVADEILTEDLNLLQDIYQGVGR